MPIGSGNSLRLEIAGEEARALAAKFGTPLYVLDESVLRNRIRRYQEALKSSWPKTSLTYAAKANSTFAVLAIAHQEGCWIDVASEGELRAAMGAGVPPDRCKFHGNNKSRSELEFAIAQKVHQIVVDNFVELENLSELSMAGAQIPSLALRLAPGVDPKTHAKISTGQADTKFGFSIFDGSAEEALTRAIERGFEVVGFHCHVGSQLFDPAAQRQGGLELAVFAKEMLFRHGFKCHELNVGGGLGVRYVESDPVPMPVEEYCNLVAGALRQEVQGTELTPVLVHEPGRWLVAEAGVTLYTVGVVKKAAIPTGERNYVVVDGGLSDNPRPALYGARYELLTLSCSGSIAEHIVTVSGKHCETDLLFEDARVNSMPEVGDILQVTCTGAYNSSMASNYNRFRRPATVLLRENSVDVVQTRESWEEMFTREAVPSDLRR